MAAGAGRRWRVVVDMTPLEPNGLNGGAGLVATSLVEQVARLAPGMDITLLTSLASHAELARLDAANVRRRCVVAHPPARSVLRRAADRLVPTRARVSLKQAYYALRTAHRYRRVADDLRPDLLVCPFTVPYFWQPGVACVSIVYDLQHVSYPAFFSAEQRLNRERHLALACQRADRLVCISDYVAATLRDHLPVCGERLVSIRLGVLQPAAEPDARVRQRLSLQPGQYLLYPANFWPHKNHPRLFEAVRSYRAAHPGSRLKLVCTGAPNALMRSLVDQGACPDAAEAAVVFAGYVSPGELAALMDGCAGLVFPSLYEGFGMPVLEAMARGRPVLCSNVTSLPEVVGDAAILFDPTDTAGVVRAIEALDDQARVAALVARGRQRAASFGGAREMASRYLDLFDQVLAARS